MVCRSTPGMSVPMGLANIDSGLDDDQIQSLVHQLRHEYAGHQQPGTEPSDTRSTGDPAAAWDTFRSATATRITAHPGLRPQRRAGLLRRITQAGDTPPADMVYAAQRIRDRAIRAARLMDDHLATEAARIGVPDARRAHQLRAGPARRTDRSATPRHRRATPRLARPAAGPTDQIRPRRPRCPTRQPRRPQRTHRRPPVRADRRHASSPEPGTTPVQGDWRSSPPTGRCWPTATSHRPWPNNSAPAPTPTTLYRDRLQGNPAFQYRDAVQAAAAGVRRRCADCGQFTGATHNCLGRRGGIRAGALGPVTPLFPTPLTNRVLPRIGPSGTDLPVRIAPLEQIIGGLERVRGEGVEFPFQATYPGGERLTGSLSGALDTDDHVSINTAHLACTCDGYAPGQGCPHTQAAATGVRDALAQQLIDSRAATAQATAAAIAGGSGTTRPDTEAALPDAPNLSTFSYAQDPARFASDVRAALARPTGEQVPSIDATDTEPGLYGYGATRDFGVELEFDVLNNAPRYGDLDLDRRINQHYRYSSRSVEQLAVGRVARALYENNFTTHDRQSGYHSGAHHGYQRNLLGGWMYEHDGSVNGGEVVSPILSDTPETWRRLHQVCGIITDPRRHCEREHRVPHHRQRPRTGWAGSSAHPVPAADAPPPAGPAHHGRRRPAPRSGLLRRHAGPTGPGVHQHQHRPANPGPVQLRERRAHCRPSDRTNSEQQPGRVPALGRVPRARPGPGADQDVHRDARLHRPQPGSHLPGRGAHTGGHGEPGPTRLRRRQQANPGTDRRLVPPRRRQATSCSPVGRRPRRPQLHP